MVIAKHAPFNKTSRKRPKLLNKPKITKSVHIPIKRNRKMCKTHFLNESNAQLLLYKIYLIN